MDQQPSKKKSSFVAMGYMACAVLLTLFNKSVSVSYLSAASAFILRFLCQVLSVYDFPTANFLTLLQLLTTLLLLLGAVPSVAKSCLF